MNFLLFDSPIAEPEIIQPSMIFFGVTAIRRGDSIYVRTKNILGSAEPRSIVAAHFHLATSWDIQSNKTGGVE